MRPLQSLRRLLANTDRLNDLLVATERVREVLDTLIDKTDSLQQGIDNQSGSSNQRLDRIYEAIDNQSGTVNERADRIYEAVDNQSGSLNDRLDRLIKAAETAGNANKGLEELVKAINNQSTAANLRLDRIIHNTRSQAANAATPPEKAAAAAVDGTGKPRTSQAGLSAAWLKAPSPAPLPLPSWSENTSAQRGRNGARIKPPANALAQYQPLLDALQPWEGQVPRGYLVDFLGILTDAHFRTMYGVDPATTGGAYSRQKIPPMDGANGEWWFETINWLAAAREARDRYVMITLGASYGAQAVGAYRTLQMVNPLPCKLVAIEPVPENCLWVGKHFRDNGIDPDAHWLINAAISDRNDPVFFPIGGAGSGANNCIATDTLSERKRLAEELIAEGKAADSLRSLMLTNTTGVIKDLLPGQDFTGEIELVSAVTLRDVLSAFEAVDYLEADIQQSEVRVFPPFLDLLKKKVRRIHIGTHGVENHDMLHSLFVDHGWDVVFSYPPNGTYETDIGSFELNDGVLTVRNPDM